MWNRSFRGIAVALVAALTTLSSRAAEDLDLTTCAFAEPPTITDGITANDGTMRTMGEDVRDYVAAMQGSLACLDDVEAGLGDRATQEQKAMITAVYNNGVDQLQFIVDVYNRQVRAFKAESSRKDAMERLD